MNPRRIWLRRLALAALLALICHQVWRHGNDYIFADKFYEVEPGKVYRGAWQQDWPMRRIVRDRKIKTIVALAHPADSDLAVREKALAGELGARWVHIPIVEDRAHHDLGIADQLEKAAAVIADPDNQPVYFHCHHGINRASMVHIAYRTLYCGWDLERATDEIAQNFGLVKSGHGPDYRFMTKFYAERVLPRRIAQARKSETAQK